MRHPPSLRSLRLTLLAAAGLGFGACMESRLDPGATSASTTGGSTSTGGGGTTTATTSVTTGVGGSGGQGGGAGGTGGTGGTFVDPVCEGAVLVFDSMGAPTGFARCPDDTFHRIAAATCDATIDAPACAGNEPISSCVTDADCTEGPNGRCGVTVQLTDDGLTAICGCHYPCSTDAECGAGKVCVCKGFLGLDEDESTCAVASCSTGADCASGECGLSVYNDGCQVDLQLGCRADTDACRTIDSCQTDGGAFAACVLPHTDTWTCTGITCSLGRPLRIEGIARRAGAAARADWTEGARPAVAHLDPSLRADLARHWIEVASLEHASVGSFARFTLELLVLGAPPALLIEAQRAGLDEVEHATIAYGLASAYAGHEVGPAPLDLRGLHVATDRRTILASLIAEGCVGETLAVAEALGVAARCEDPLLRAIHLRIAADEERHAALAFRALAHLLATADVAERAFVRACFIDAARSAAADPPSRGRSAPAEGLLPASELGALRRQALREVVEPCAAALLESFELKALRDRSFELEAITGRG